MTATCAAALAYSEAGLSVIPTGKDKRPLCSWERWQSERADDATIRKWFRNGANVAIIGGVVSGGLVVLDFDEPQLFFKWKKATWEISKTLPQQKTGRGYHVFFKCPTPGGNEKIAPEIDKKAEGGYVVVAPSIHSSGVPYQIVEGDLTNIPTISQADADTLLQIAREIGGAAKNQNAYAEAALTDELDALARATEGGRNDQLNKTAFALGQFVGAGALERGEVERRLTATALVIGLGEREARATIQSGLDAGMKEPRDIPSNGHLEQIEIPVPTLPKPGKDDSLCPALPDSARLDADLGLDACQWLDDYIAFSRKWSPRSFDGFHEACGLWLLSTIAARRVVLNFGKPFYTPLYIALTARTSLYAKSTVGDIAIQTLRAAGLDWLLTPDDSTPQAFVRGLSRRVPDDFSDLPDADQARIKNRLALAGQRGWFYEEFGQHIAAMMREGGVMADFRGLLRRFDDCKEGYTTETIGRGSVKVERPYLSLLALLTPADLAPFARRGAALWGDGFLARFALITPDGANDNRARFPDSERIIPSTLLDPLRQWHSRLGMPNVEIEDITNDEGEPTGRKRAVVSEHAPQICTMEKGIADAFYNYHDGLLDLVRESERTELDGNYSRFAEKAMRMAILFASLENGNRIEMRHWARAQEIAERWRSNLHSLFEQVTARDEPGYKRTQEDRVIKCLRRHSPASAFEIGRYTGLSTDEAETILKSLVEAGAVTPLQTNKTTKYQL